MAYLMAMSSAAIGTQLIRIHMARDLFRICGEGQLPIAILLAKKPTGCLLGACSGQHPMGYRFSLLTLLFSGVFAMIKPQNSAKFRLIL